MQYRSHNEWRRMRSLPVTFAVKADSDRLIIFSGAVADFAPVLLVINDLCSLDDPQQDLEGHSFAPFFDFLPC